MDILESLKDPDFPQILYKYRRFDKKGHSLDILRNGELYHTSISKLNDPFDCAISYTFDASMLDMRKYAGDVVKRHFPEASKEERRVKIKEMEAKITAPNWGEGARQDIQEIREDEFGICCLSTPRDNLLLWAHYADEHRGLCIGLSTEKLGIVQLGLVKSRVLLDLLKVEYSPDMPQISIIDSMLRPDGKEDIYTMISTKSSDWKYEKEYRLVYWGHPDGKLSVGREAIAEVILGCRCSDANREKTLAVMPDGVPVYQAEQKERIFGLDFDKIQ